VQIPTSASPVNKPPEVVALAVVGHEVVVMGAAGPAQGHRKPARPIPELLDGRVGTPDDLAQRNLLLGLLRHYDRLSRLGRRRGRLRSPWSCRTPCTAWSWSRWPLGLLGLTRVPAVLDVIPARLRELGRPFPPGRRTLTWPRAASAAALSFISGRGRSWEPPAASQSAPHAGRR